MLVDLEYGEIELALGFLKLLRGELPFNGEMQEKAQEVGYWLYRKAGDEQQRDIIAAQLLWSF